MMRTQAQSALVKKVRAAQNWAEALVKEIGELRLSWRRLLTKEKGCIEGIPQKGSWPWVSRWERELSCDHMLVCGTSPCMSWLFQMRESCRVWSHEEVRYFVIFASLASSFLSLLSLSGDGFPIPCQDISQSHCLKKQSALVETGELLSFMAVSMECSMIYVSLFSQYDYFAAVRWK